MELYKHQQDLIKENPKCCLLAHSTGTGKTRTAIELVYKNCQTFLVVCPKALKEKWKYEIDFWREGRGAGWKVISKEEFRRDWDKIERFDGIIFDEGHYFFGIKSQMSKSAISYIKKYKVEYIYSLTATPFLSTPWNIFMAAKILGYNWNYMLFKRKFFVDVRFGRRIVPVVRSGIEDDIASLVSTIGSIVNMDECADIPEQVFEVERISLTVDQKKNIEGVREVLPIVRFTKIHQIENGVLKSDGYTENKFYDCGKLERIADLCVEFPKVAVFCRYNLQIDAIKDYLERYFEGKRPVYIIRGDVTDRHKVVEAVEASSECVVVINSACSEGYELPTVPTIVFASLSFSYKDYKQSIGRFLRLNKLKKNLYITLISGEVDEAVYNSIMNKQDFDLAIYARKR